jgi:hypothetical protein
MASWRDAGIPLRVVLQALDNVFASRSASHPSRPVLSLSYCQHAVKEAFDSWREAQVGAPAGAAEPAAEPGPNETAGCLEGWARALLVAAGESHLAGASLQRTAERLRQMAAAVQAVDPPSLAQMEEELESLEDLLLDELLAELAPASRQELEEEAARELAPLEGRLTERAYRATFQVHLRARLRARHSLPRLTLYAL